MRWRRCHEAATMSFAGWTPSWACEMRACTISPAFTVRGRTATSCETSWSSFCFGEMSQGGGHLQGFQDRLFDGSRSEAVTDHVNRPTVFLQVVAQFVHRLVSLRQH